MSVIENKIIFAICLITLLLGPISLAQSSVNEIQSLIEKAKSRGLSDLQIEALAKARGIDTKASGAVLEPSSVQTEVEDRLAVVKPQVSDNSTKTVVGKSTNDPLFGYDFFNNPSINFQPNFNLPTPANYQLGPGDALVISLWGAAENTYNVEVNRNGELKIPNIGPINVTGMTIEDATSKIKNRLTRVYQGISAPNNSSYKVDVDISLARVRTVQVNIIGQVKVPGSYSLSALTTVLNALYACGGPSKQGTFREIKLIRNGVEISSFDVYKYLVEGSQKGNVTVKDQDVILVGPYISKVSISGNLKRPGIYEIKPDENFSDLLNFVGGFTSDAYKDVIKLIRINGDRKELKEISYTNFKEGSLKDGDLIRVGGIINNIENKITIEGAVYRPGDFEYTPGISFLDLINKASGLLESAYSNRVLLSRKVDSEKREIFTYALEDILNGTERIELQKNDIVRVFNKSSFNDKGIISISGAVNNPSTIPYYEGITLEEIVLLASGYGRRADTKVIDVTREIIDDDYETITESFQVSAENSLDIDNNTPFVFKPNDKVIVRSLVGSSDRATISVEGEVLFPGNYDVTFKNEKILDLINKAGGLSPYAFEEGISLVRKNPFYKEVTQQLNSQAINDTTLTKGVNLNLNNLKEFPIAIDYKRLLKEGEGSKINMVLKTGDRLIIPSIKETVKIEGQVLLPSLVRFDTNLSFKEYISKSGGFNENAKKRKSFVIYPNGNIASTKSFLFFKSFPEIKPGALIIVPTKKERKSSISAGEILGISTGFATLALLIERITD